MNAPNTLSEAASAFLGYLADYRRFSPATIRAYRSDLRDFCASFGPTIPAPEAVTRQDVLRFAVALRCSAQTVRRKVTTVSSLYRYLQDLGAVSENPARGIPLPRRAKMLPIAPSREEILQIVRAARLPWLRCALILLATTGIRRAELVGLRLQDVDLETGTLLVNGKGNKQRFVPLNEVALEAIRTYLPIRARHARADTLLVNQRGLAVVPGGLFHTFRMAVWRAGLRRAITPHTFRHAFATELIRERVDIRTVQELLGHESLETTARYLHSDMRIKRDATAALAGMFREAAGTGEKMPVEEGGAGEER